MSSSPTIFVVQTLESHLSQCKVAGRRRPCLHGQFYSQNYFFLKSYIAPIHVSSSPTILLRKLWSQIFFSVKWLKGDNHVFDRNLTLKIIFFKSSINPVHVPSSPTIILSCANFLVGSVSVLSGWKAMTMFSHAIWLSK